MSNSTKYLSYEGLSYFKNIIEGRYEKKGHTHSYVPTKTVTFTPAETAIGPAEVLSKLGSGYALGKGTWDYAGNGYISKDTTGSIAIDLAGSSIIQFGGSSAYTQLYITAPASTTTNSKTNEMLFYNNHGSSYSPAWTRVLTNRNYSEYCASAGHTHNKLTIKGIDAATTHGDYMGILQNASVEGLESNTWYNVIKILHNNSAGYYTEFAQSFTGTEGLYHRRMSNGAKSNWRHVLDSVNYSSYALPVAGGALTGPLVFNGTDTDRNIIRINNGTGDATTKSYYGFTLKYLGSGTGNENALALYSDNQTATSQIQIAKILQDGTLNSRSILPISNNTYSLGNSSYKWSNIYATTFTGNLTGNVTGNASSATKIGAYTSSDIFVRQSRPDNGFNIDEIELFGMRDIQSSSEITRTGTFPFHGWGSLMSFNGANYFVQFATASTSGGLYFRSIYGAGVKLTDKPWVKFLDSSNTTYTASVTSGTSGAYQIGTLKIGGTETTIYGKDTNTTYTSLKNPYSLHIVGSSGRIASYDGSSTVTATITATSIGAAETNHTHDTLTPEEVDTVFTQFGITFQ